MPSRLTLAKAQIKSFKEDISFNRTIGEKEIKGLEKLTQALSLIRQAEADFVNADIKRETKGK